MPKVPCSPDDYVLPFCLCILVFICCLICYAGGKLLLELNRLLRPGGYFVWSATPVYEKEPEDVQIWEGKSRFYLIFVIKTVL